MKKVITIFIILCTLNTQAQFMNGVCGGRVPGEIISRREDSIKMTKYKQYLLTHMYLSIDSIPKVSFHGEDSNYSPLLVLEGRVPMLLPIPKERTTMGYLLRFRFGKAFDKFIDSITNY